MSSGPPFLRAILPAFLAGAGLGILGTWGALRKGDESTRTSSGPGPSPSSSRDKTYAGETRGDWRNIQRLQDPPSRARAFRALMDGMTPAELARLMKDLERFRIDQEQEDLPGGLMALETSRQLALEHAASGDPAAVLAALSATGGRENGSYYQDVLRLWASRDPDAARMFFETHTMRDPGLDAKSIAGALAREMVKTDPEGTMQWLRGLKTAFAEDVARDALQTLSHYDGVLAGKLLARHADLRKAPEFVAAMAAGWARTEPDKAFAWARDLPVHLAAEGLSTSAGIWAGKDFPAALAAVDALQGDARAAALKGMANTSAQTHLHELIPKVDALPESPSRAAAVASLVNAWVDESPEKASDWLSRQPEGPSRDEGAVVLALKTFEADPASSLDWAAAIGGEEQRRKGVEGLVDAWLRKDPKAARNWVATSPRLSEAERARLIEKTGR